MLDLDSPRWKQLPGGNGERVAKLIKSLADNPTELAWGELGEQLAHQWTLTSYAYAALPHILRLGIAQGRSKRADFLLDLARIAAPVSRLHPCPADLQQDFTSALRQAGEIALCAATNSEYKPEEYVCALQAAAALTDRRGPGIELFFVLGTGNPEAELECPDCQAYLLTTFTDDGGAYIQSVDDRMKPISDRAPVTPRTTLLASDNGDRRLDDFDWLAALCETAKQQQVLQWLCLLYGQANCPVCGKALIVMNEVERSQEFHSDVDR